MARRGGGARALGIAVLLIGAALAVAAVTRKEPEIPNGEPPPDNGDNGGNGNGPLTFEPVLLGEPTVLVNPF